MRSAGTPVKSHGESPLTGVDLTLPEQPEVILRTVYRLRDVDSAAEKPVQVVAVGAAGLYQPVAVCIELRALVV